MTRRDLASVFPALWFTRGGSADSQTLHSATFDFGALPVTTSSGGAATRPVLHGRLGTGEMVELHETTLQPGQMPHPAHRHAHSEFMLIREGTVEFILDGRSEQIGPGGVAYAASGELHGLKNSGVIPANYFVIAIGTEPERS